MYKINKIYAKLLKRGDYLINTDIEFRKGILFVRINNLLNKNDYINNKNAIIELIKKVGIKYLVLNFDDKCSNDFKIKLIINNYKYISKCSGKLLLCGYVDISIYNDTYINKIKSEIDAFKIIG